MFYVRVGILLTRGKHYHHRIILPRGKAEAHSLVERRHFSYEVPVLSKYMRDHICALGVSILLLSTIFYWILEMFRHWLFLFIILSE